MSEEATYTAHKVAPADVSDFVRRMGKARKLSFHRLYRGLTIVEGCVYQQGFPFSDMSYSTMQDAMAGTGVEFVAVVYTAYNGVSLFESDSTLYYGVSEGMLYTGENPEALGIVCLTGEEEQPGFTVTSAGQVGGRYYDCRVLYFSALLDSLADDVSGFDDVGEAPKPLTTMEGLYRRMHSHPDASELEMERNRLYWILLGTIAISLSVFPGAGVYWATSYRFFYLQKF